MRRRVSVLRARGFACLHERGESQDRRFSGSRAHRRRRLNMSRCCAHRSLFLPLPWLQACQTVFKDADEDFSTVAAVKKRLEDFKARFGATPPPRPRTVSEPSPPGGKGSLPATSRRTSLPAPRHCLPLSFGWSCSGGTSCISRWRAVPGGNASTATRGEPWGCLTADQATGAIMEERDVPGPRAVADF